MPRQCFAAYLRQHCDSSEWQAACVVMLRCHQEQLVALGVVESRWANIPGEQGVQVVGSSHLIDTVRYRSIVAGSFDELQRHVETSNVLPFLTLPPRECASLSLLATKTQHPLVLQDAANDKVWMQWHEETMHNEACPLGVATLTLANHCTIDHGRIERTADDLTDAFTVVGLLYSPGPRDNQGNNATTQVILCARVSSSHSEMVATAWRDVGAILTRQLVQLRLMAGWLHIPLAASGSSTCRELHNVNVCFDCGQRCFNEVEMCMGCLVALCSHCCQRSPVQFKARQGWAYAAVEDSHHCRRCWSDAHVSNYAFESLDGVESSTLPSDNRRASKTTSEEKSQREAGTATAEDAMAYLLSLVRPKSHGSKALTATGHEHDVPLRRRCRCLVTDVVPHFEVIL